MSLDQEAILKLVGGLNAAHKQHQGSAAPAPAPTTTPSNSRMKTPEYVSNFGPPANVDQGVQGQGDQGGSAFKSEAMVSAEDMMDIDGGEAFEESGNAQQPQVPPGPPTFVAPFEGHTTNTVVDLRLAVKALYESRHFHAANHIRGLGQWMYPYIFNDTLLTAHGVPNQIPVEDKKYCGNSDALELLKSAYKNASAMEGKQAASAVKQAIEHIYGAGLLDEMAMEWEEANLKAKRAK